MSDINGIRNILKGNFSDIVEEMKHEMLSLADQLRFEEAEMVKRRIRRLEEYQSRSTVVNTSVKDVDVFGILSDEKYAYVHMMRIKNGSIIYSFSHEIRKQLFRSGAAEDHRFAVRENVELAERTDAHARRVGF